MASPSSSVFLTTTKSFLMKLDIWEAIASMTTVCFHGKLAVWCIWAFWGGLGVFVSPGPVKD